MVPDRAESSLELLYRIGRQLVSSLDLQTVLERVLTSRPKTWAPNAAP